MGNLAVVYPTKNVHAPVQAVLVCLLPAETKEPAKADLTSSCSQSGILVMTLASIMQTTVRYGIECREATYNRGSVRAIAVGGLHFGAAIGSQARLTVPEV